MIHVYQNSTNIQESLPIHCIKSILKIILIAQVRFQFSVYEYNFFFVVGISSLYPIILSAVVYPFSYRRHDNYLIKVTDDVMNLCCLALWVHIKNLNYGNEGIVFSSGIIIIMCMCPLSMHIPSTIPIPTFYMLRVTICVYCIRKLGVTSFLN